MKIALCALLLTAGCAEGCRSGGGATAQDVLPPAWPESDRRSPQLELSLQDDLPSPVDEREPIPPELAGVQVRDGELEGFYYIEVVLGDAGMQDDLPLVVLLHGRGDRPRVPGGPFGGVDRPVRVLLPRAPARLRDGWTWLPVRVLDGRTEELAESLAAMSDRLADLIDAFSVRRACLGKPIVAGFSQGGLLAFALATRHPELVGAAFPLSGWLPPQLVPERAPEESPPIRSMHGTADDVVPIDPTRETITDLRAAGFDAELVELAGVRHEVTPEMNALFRGWLSAALEQVAPLPLGPVETEAAGG